MGEAEVEVVFRGAPRQLSRRLIREFAAQLSRQVARGASFTCLLASDKEIQALNRQFLGRDYPTDVLAFPEPDEDLYLGDIAISVDRAAEQARQFGHSLEEEIKILMLHGVLHLLGMDHETDRGQMARAETRWRKKLGLPASMIERARR